MMNCMTCIFTKNYYVNEIRAAAVSETHSTHGRVRKFVRSSRGKTPEGKRPLGRPRPRWGFNVKWT
jgi:hypothetical protein